MKVYCVIVCYFPEKPALERLCNVIIEEDGVVVLVDNSGSDGSLLGRIVDNVLLVTPLQNTGIARGQNIGVEKALACGADVIIFFDQDTTVPRGVIKTLVSELEVGVPDIVAPIVYDDVGQVAFPSLRVSSRGFRKSIHLDGVSEPYEVDVVISSGTTATKEVFQAGVRLDEDLFIDYVDVEWCLRSRAAGIRIRVVPQAVIHHRIGSRSESLGSLLISVHAPSRCYYQIRNAFHLGKKPHVPKAFFLRELVSTFVNRGLLLFFVEDVQRYLLAYWRGFIDGVRGVVGPREFPD